MADNFREDEGIVLNSIDVSETLYGNETIYYAADEDVLYNEDNMGYSSELPDQDTNMEHQYSSSVSLVADTKFTLDVGISCGDMNASWSSSSADSKRRLRLAKAEYESMSEEDRRVRHRVLDNQRSKQHRERR